MPDQDASRRAPDQSVVVELIKSQWQDIHQSQRGDWKYWVVLAAIAGGFFALGSQQAPAGGQSNMLFVGLSVLGTLVSLLAAINARSQGELRLKKTARIASLEQRLLPGSGGQTPDGWQTSGVSFAAYVMFAVNFVVWPRVIGATTVSAAGGWVLLAGESAVVFVIAYVGYLWSLQATERRCVELIASATAVRDDTRDATAEAEPAYATAES